MTFDQKNKNRGPFVLFEKLKYMTADLREREKEREREK